jgi:hypothetical protein
LVVLLFATPSLADIDDALEAYTGVNAQGYLGPLVDAFAAELNSGFFHSAYVPRSGLHITFGLNFMGRYFADEDRTFTATTEGGFMPVTTINDAPTVVGPGTAVTVPGQGGTSFTFPGGLDLNSFGIVIPYLNIGSILGTEAQFRFLAFDVSDSDLGDVQLVGGGIRHSIDQHFDTFPVALAIGGYYQNFQVGNDLITSDAFSLGLQTSKRWGVFEPYAGFSFDSFRMDLEWESTASGSPEINTISFESRNTVHLTLGLSLKLSFLSAYADYNIAETSNFNVGAAAGF